MADGAAPLACSIAEFLATAKLDDASLSEPHGYQALLAAGGLDQLEDLEAVDEALLEALGMAKIMHRKRFMRHMARMPSRPSSAPERRAAPTPESPLAPGPASAHDALLGGGAKPEPHKKIQPELAEADASADVEAERQTATVRAQMVGKKLADFVVSKKIG